MTLIQSKHNYFPLWIISVATAIATTSCSHVKEAQAGTSAINQKKASAKKHSSFDFVRGNKILWQDNFSSSKVGDMPKTWNTNAGAEIVSEEGSGKHSLQFSKDGVYIPSAITLPQNFTLEFSLSSSNDYSFYSSPFQIMFAGLTSKKEFTALKQYNPHNKDVVKIWIHPTNSSSKAGYTGYELWEKGVKKQTNETNNKEFFSGGGIAAAKVSIWRQGQRLCVYLNEEKIWDLSEAFVAKAGYNSLVFGISHLVDHTGSYFMSDVVLATEDGK